jgi:hypothetical protein
MQKNIKKRVKVVNVSIFLINLPLISLSHKEIIVAERYTDATEYDGAVESPRDSR